MHDPERARYAFASLTEAMSRIINIKQRDDESLIDYTCRFKQACDVFKSHVGADILDTFMETMQMYVKCTSNSQCERAKKEHLHNGQPISTLKIVTGKNMANY